MSEPKSLSELVEGDIVGSDLLLSNCGTYARKLSYGIYEILGFDMMVITERLSMDREKVTAIFDRRKKGEG